MTLIIQTVVTAIVAACAWVSVEFGGRPLRRFFDLRGDVIRRLVQFANVRARYKPVPDDSGATSGQLEVLDLEEDEIRRLNLAQETFRDLASQMSAFACNETAALWAARRMGYDPAEASASLIGYSNALPKYGHERAFYHEKLAKALGLKNVPGLLVN